MKNMKITMLATALILSSSSAVYAQSPQAEVEQLKQYLNSAIQQLPKEQPLPEEQRLTPMPQPRIPTGGFVPAEKGGSPVPGFPLQTKPLKDTTQNTVGTSWLSTITEKMQDAGKWMGNTAAKQALKVMVKNAADYVPNTQAQQFLISKGDTIIDNLTNEQIHDIALGMERGLQLIGEKDTSARMIAIKGLIRLTAPSQPVH